MSINLSSTFAKSGIFETKKEIDLNGGVSRPTAEEVKNLGNPRVFNPAVRDQLRNSYTFESIDAKEAKSLEDRDKLKIVDEAIIAAYGKECIQGAKDLSLVHSHLRLGPLRGAARPCLLLDAMTAGSKKYTFFNYKAGCQPANAGRVKEDLYRILCDADPRDAIYRIQIVDTAIGGQGIRALRRYLREVKDAHARFRKQKWELDLRIFHGTGADTNVNNIRRVETDSSSGDFVIKLRRYVVPDLIVERYDAALGVRIDKNAGQYRIRQSYEPGNFILESSQGFRLVRSDALVVTFDELFTNSITEEMLTSSDFEQVGEVWNRELQE